MANYWFLASTITLVVATMYWWFDNFHPKICLKKNEVKKLVCAILIILTAISGVAFLSSIESVKYASSTSTSLINQTYEVVESTSSVESFSFQNVDVSNFSFSCFDKGNATMEFLVDNRLQQWANSRETIDFTCAHNFKDEERMRLINNEWKCHCVFDYSYEINDSFTRRTFLTLFNVTNFTKSGCIENCDSWSGRRNKVQYGKKSWIEGIKVNDTLLTEEKAYNIRTVKARFENTSIMKIFPETETGGEK